MILNSHRLNVGRGSLHWPPLSDYYVEIGYYEFYEIGSGDRP